MSPSLTTRLRARRAPVLVPTLIAASVALAMTQARAQSTADGRSIQQLPDVEVVGTSPVPGLEQPRDEVPANVHSMDAATLRDSQAVSLPDLFGSRMPSVNVNEIQGNPFQADVNFRGFTASPLLGTPQGLSVYVDGVRVNEPFGDIVSWDLIPRAAIRSMDLIPGSNPLFGLNTLGGALSVHTKNGFDDAGTEAEVSVGSFARREADVSHGMKLTEDTALFLAASWFKENGWRDFSPSEVRQVFAKLSHRTAKADFDLGVSHADNDLIGNGLLPESWYKDDRSSIFTRPDQTENRLTAITLNAGYWLTDSARLSGTLYHRRNRQNTLNGDVNDDFEDSVNDAECDPGDFTDPQDIADCNAAIAAGGIEDATATLNRTATRQNGTGVSLQFAHYGERNQFAVGTTFDRSRVRFNQSEQEGVFDDTRGVEATEEEEEDVSLRGSTRTWSLFVTDTVKPLPGVAVTLSGRFNHTRVKTTDQLDPTPPNLDNDFTYRKFNPAVGLTWAIQPNVTFYAGAGQGNRAPSPIELGCADPDEPCKLPNAMQADPYLKQVVSRSVEAGLRGRAGSLRWNAGAFAAENRDDILFVGTGTGLGYFTNFGKTRRQGVELGASGDVGRATLRASYSYVRATFESSGCLLGEANSTRGTAPECTAEGQDDEILVKSGDRIPGIPEHSLKLGADWRVSERVSLFADVIAYSSQYVRGNENNEHQSGDATDAFGETRSFEGAGKIPAYAILNIGANAKLGGGWEVFGRVNNVFDKHYASAGALAENPFNAAGAFQTSSDDWTNETFFGPGAKRAGWIGVRYRFGG
jgi:outer membrane receptor protein involved in Fe transport